MAKVPLTIRLGEDLHKWITEEADKRSMSVNALISYVLSEYREEKDSNF